MLFLIWIFGYSQSLKIDLSNRGLEVVPRNLDSSVSTLILDNNRLITLNYNSFDMYPHLRKISLRFCQTAYIEDGTFDNHDELVSISLDQCRIAQLPQSFGPSTTIMREFSIYNGFASTAIFKFPYFTAFLSLKMLTISGIKFKTFNTSILPPNIEILKLDFIRLVTFPYLNNQSRLNSLSIMGNSIALIPREHIISLSDLIKLRLDGNKIQSFPNVSHMKKLQSLKISNNDIPLFSREYVSELESLEYFMGSQNLLQAMPNISYLSKLKVADFSNNFIRYVQASCLNGISMIQSLYLNGNRIILMEDNSMTSGNLYIHDNHLASPPDLYDMMISSLTLQGNPLVCDQLLCWLRMWPFNKTLPQLDEFRCTSPSSLNGSLVMDVHPTVLGCYRGKSWNIIWLCYIYVNCAFMCKLYLDV